MEAKKIPDVEGSLLEVCVIPEGKFFEKDWFGKKRQIGYDKSAIQQMVENWEKKILHYDPILNISHDDELVGEVQSLFAIFDSEDKQNGLWAKIQLNEMGQNLLDKHQYRYLSPEIYHGYLDADGNDKGYVFAGVALTNYPRHKRMKKLSFSELFEKLMRWEGNEIELEGEIMSENSTVDNKELLAELEQTKELLNKFQEERRQLQIDKWVAEMKPEGYTPAAIDRFTALLSEGKVDFDLATELIQMTQKVELGQTVASFKKVEHEVDLEEMGKEENAKFTTIEVNNDA